MGTGDSLARVLVVAIALLLFAAAYVAASLAWAYPLDVTGDWSLESTDRGDVVWLVLVASALWAAPLEAWLVIAAAALGIGGGLRAWAAACD